MGKRDSKLLEVQLRKDKAQNFTLPPPDETGLFLTRDGTSIYYEVRGSGKALLFCYGLVCRIEHWRHQLIHFQNQYRLITFDYRGHHRSSVPENDRHITLEWCARDLQDLIRHLRLEEVVILGHSLGVPIGSLASVLEPSIVKALVLICGAMKNPFSHMFHSDKMNQIYRIGARLYELAPDAMAGLWFQLTRKNPLSYLITSRLGFNAALAAEEDVLSYLEGVNQAPFSVFQSLISDYVTFRGDHYLKKIKCPVLVLAGERDCITPLNIMNKMARTIPKGSFELIPEGSHNAHTELGSLVNEKIGRFLEKIHYQ